jgi:hypothetical protein
MSLWLSVKSVPAAIIRRVVNGQPHLVVGGCDRFFLKHFYNSNMNCFMVLNQLNVLFHTIPQDISEQLIFYFVQ